MSEEKVEIVRQAVDAFNARDRERRFDLMDPEIEFRSVLERKTYPRSRRACGVAMSEENVEIIVPGDDSQSVLLELLGAPATSGKST